MKYIYVDENNKVILSTGVLFPENTLIRSNDNTVCEFYQTSVVIVYPLKSITIISCNLVVDYVSELDNEENEIKKILEQL